MVKTLTVLAYILGGPGHAANALTLESPAFHDKGVIPMRYTCRGRNEMLPLRWHGVPFGTHSLVLVMTDRDAPREKKYVWELYNIPPKQKHISGGDRLYRGEHYALNSMHTARYQSVCPPKGKTHHYELTLYALNVHLYFGDQDIDAKHLLRVVRPHILSTAKLNGIFPAAKRGA